MAAKILGLHIRLSGTIFLVFSRASLIAVGNFYEKDFLDLPAVQTIKDKPIYELFKIFKFGSYDDFVAFADKNSAFFAEYGACRISFLVFSVFLFVVSSLNSHSPTSS